MSKQASQRIVALDTMTLIWGMRKKGDAAGVKHAKYLFQTLEQEEDTQIVVPSVVIAEFVTPLKSNAERTEVVARMRERFLIAPFDAQDAILAADLWNRGKTSRQMKRQGARVCLRADAFIVATAYNHGEQVFYTDDEDCFKMANRIMKAKHLPRVPPTLFSDQD